MRTRKLLTMVSLLCAFSGVLAGCAVTLPPAEGDNASGVVSAAGDGQSGEDITCDLPESSPAPLAAPEDGSVYQPLNFQPQTVEVADGVVAFSSAAYTFSFCVGEDAWSVTSAETAQGSEADDFDYDAYLDEIADPSYDAVEVEGDRYEYRARLQAEWLREQRAEAEQGLEPGAAENTTETEEAVYFELKTPDGEIVSHLLYSLDDLQEAGLGVSLGVPSIAGAVVVEDGIWFAATTSQGEGDGGFASLIHYDLETSEVKVHQPEEIQGSQINAIALTVGSGTESSESESSESESSESESSEPESSEPESSESESSEPESSESDLPEAESSDGASSSVESTDAEPADDASSSSDARGSNADTFDASSDTSDAEDSEPDGITLWLGTQRSGEGNPYAPSDGLVAYEPATATLTSYTLQNSPIVGAIPTQLAVLDEQMWVGTGNGFCQVQWQAISEPESWNCWRVTLMAMLPESGVDLYPSFLAEEPADILTEPEVEVLWLSRELEADVEAGDDSSEPTSGKLRYEVVYAPGLEVELAQGGYRITNEVALRLADGDTVFWPGRDWHWAGDRFVRGFDEVALNLVGGGPYGLVKSNSRTGFSLDTNAIRGDFDLLSLDAEGTKVRHYSGWIAGEDLEIYPKLVAVTGPDTMEPNPLDELMADLPASSGP